jgi:O-antigen/teichoic acid export membrane protein
MRRALAVIGQAVIGQEESVALRDRLVAAAGGLIGLRIAFSGLSFLGGIVLARLLGQRGLGFYVYALSWITLIGVPAILGMDQFLIREVAAYQAKSQWGPLRGLLRKATVTVFLASTGMALAAAAMSWWFLRGRGPSQALYTFWAALLLIPLIALTRVRQAVMQGLHRVTRGSAPEQVVQPGLLLIFLSVMYLLPNYRLTAPSAMGLTALAAAVAFGTGAILLYRTLPQAVKEAAPVYRNLSLASSTLPLLCISGVSVLFGQADTLILGAMRGAASVGAYAVAHKSADLISYTLIIQGSAFASTAASLYALRDIERLQRLVTRLARWTLLGATLIALFLIGFGRWFLSLYGPQFVQAHVTLAILACSQLVNVAAGMVGLLLIMTGHERDGAAAIGAGALANIALTFALAPRWGAEGAAVAFAIGMVVWNVWAAIALWRKAGIHATALGQLHFRKRLRFSG